MAEYNILYVDDEEANLTSLKSLFRRKFNIVTANSGQQGLEILAAQPIHLIIADQRMPAMTGIEFLKKVKQKWPEIKYILLTGFYDNEVLKEAVNDVGIFWYMNKPFNNDKLEHIIYKALESFNTTRLLKESEEKFRGVFNSMADVFVRRELTGKVVMVSPSIYDVVGYTPDEILNNQVKNYFVDPQMPERIMKKLLAEGGTHFVEPEVFKKDGSIIVLASSAKLYFDDAGNPLGIESVFRDVTESKRAETALKESEEKFKSLFNSIIDVFVRRNLAHKVVLISPSIVEVTGYSVGEITGADLSNYFVDPQEPERIKQKLLNEGGPQTFEFDLYKKDGNVISISSNAKLYYDNAGKPIGIESVFRDVSDQKKAAEALKETKERYQSLSDASFEAIFISEKGVCLEQNALAEKMFGYTLGEAVGKMGTDWIIPEDREKVMNNMLSGYEKAYEITAMRKDGSTFPAEIQGRMMHFQGKDVRVTALNDISRRKQAEEALIESEEKFRNLITNTEEIIYIIAKDGTFILSEGKGLSELGLKPGEVVGESVFELYKESPDILAQMREAFKGKTVNEEAKVGDFYFKNWYTPQTNLQGEIIGLLGLSINITEQKQAEVKILEYQNRLKEVSMELILSEEKQRKQIAVDLHDHVGQLLAASRMQLMGLMHESENVVINKKIKDISQGLLQAVRATREAIFNLSPPQLNEIGLFAAVHDWLEQEVKMKYPVKARLIGENQKYNLSENIRFLIFRSIRELIMNTVKHARAKHLNVKIGGARDFLEITIQDDGIGFAEDPESMYLKSTGYGLFSTRERVIDIGGSMTIDSKPGQGATIKIVVPLIKKQDEKQGINR